MSFEWDALKSRGNLSKHGVHFADAVVVFEDELALTVQDDDSDEEDRFITMGRDGLARILVVVYTWRDDDIRLISARPATRHEVATYEGDR